MNINAILEAFEELKESNSEILKEIRNPQRDVANSAKLIDLVESASLKQTTASNAIKKGLEVINGNVGSSYKHLEENFCIQDNVNAKSAKDITDRVLEIREKVNLMDDKLQQAVDLKNDNCKYEIYIKVLLVFLAVFLLSIVGMGLRIGYLSDVNYKYRCVVLKNGISSSELRGLEEVFDVDTPREGRREFRRGVRELERKRKTDWGVGWWQSFKDSVDTMF